MSLDILTEQQALIPTMSKLMKELKAIITKELKANKIDLTKEQAIVLKILSEQDGRQQNELALVTCRDKTSLTRLLSTMEKKQLINRSQSETDRRVNRVYLTVKGRKEIIKAIPIIQSVFERAIKGIDKKRVGKTKQLLNDIYINLNLNHEEQK